MAPELLTFEAPLEANGFGFMPMHMVIVPEAVVEALGGKGVKRVVGSLNGHPIRRGLLPLRSGERYLLVSKDLCRQLGLVSGAPVSVQLAPDPEPNYVDLPEELAEGLATWPEAEEAFQRLTPGRQRNIVHYLTGAKRPETRAQRVVQVLHQLADGTHPTQRATRQR